MHWFDDMFNWSVFKGDSKNPYQGCGTGQSFIHSGYKQKMNKKKKTKNRIGRKAKRQNRRK